MKTPDWIQSVLDGYAEREKPFQECEISSSLNKAANAQTKVTVPDGKCFMAEWSAFNFDGNSKKTSVWGTYFGPMMTLTKADAVLYRPDLNDLDADSFSYLEERVTACKNPVMRARYADVVWDMKQKVSKQKASIEFARLAIDAYLEAIQSDRYEMEMFGVEWLARALQLARSVKDEERTKRVVDCMFAFHDKIADVKRAGTWFFLFDLLYGEKCTTAEQEKRLIDQLEVKFSQVTDLKPSETGTLKYDTFSAEGAADRLIQYYRKLGSKPDVERVTKAYGATVEHMVQQAAPIMASIFLPKLVERYKQEGLKDDAERAQLLAEAKGKNIAADMKTIHVESEIKKEDVDALVAKLVLPGDLEGSLVRIAVYFMPDVNAARNLLERLRTDAPFLSMMPVNFVDEDGNPTAVMGALDDDEEGRVYQQLGRSLQFLQPIFGHTLSKLRETLHPTVDDIIRFLSKSPVFATHRPELLRDGLDAYHRGDFVKAIHVLIPQVESSLREFLEKLGAPVRKPSRGRSGVNEAKSLNDILLDQRVREALGERLWRYLALVFVEKRGGLNLRNEVAHGLLDPTAFNQQIADYVFHSLLALSLIRERDKRA